MAIQTVKTGAAVNDGTGDDARTAFTKINQNFTDSANAASRLVGEAAGNVMEVGAFGLGNVTSADAGDLDLRQVPLGFYKYPDGSPNIPPKMYIWDTCFLNIKRQSSLVGAALFFPYVDSPTNQICLRAYGANRYSDFYFYTDRNTIKDSNGFIKGASPVIQLFGDKIELNDEAQLQQITLEKLGVGDYLIKGSTGFAQEGWYIEMPKDANGNVLVAVIYEQLANNDISVKTYDYMLNKKGRIVPDLETPLDIPETRWIDLRLQALPQANPQPFNTDETVATNAE